LDCFFGLNLASPELKSTKESLTKRAWKATSKKAIKDNAEVMISDRSDRWVKEAGRRPSE
jgi:hypothetical protein